jgi:pyruvate/2-oxoacid:ferredoxin oxidoreductase alpha subunit
MTIKVCNGNEATAYAVMMSRPDVIATYPITPQTPIIEKLSQFRADGLLEAEMINVEGENSAMSALIGASAAGGRVFTSTSSNGLAFMYDAVLWCAGQRLPVVMANVNRETTSITTVANGHQDIMSIRDAGWVHIQAENCQEIFDSIVIAFRLAEDPEIMLPVVISYDGYFLSHLSERIEIPEQELVDRFLAPLRRSSRMKIVPNQPIHFSTYCVEKLFVEYQYKHCAALERVKTKLGEVEREFAAMFGREQGGLAEAYRVEDAEVVLIASGRVVGTAREVIDEAWNEGRAVGLIKLRVFRPFPSEALISLLKGKKAIGVLDQSICLGWNRGHIFTEVKALLHELDGKVPLVNFIDGISNLDITPEHLRAAVEITIRAGEGQNVPLLTWLCMD